MEDGVDCEGEIDCAQGLSGYPCCLAGYALEHPEECEEPGDCVPGAPDYPDCLINEPEYTACGCAIAGGVSNKRPRGRVTVEDTVLDPDAVTEGVRNVKVKTKANHWFSFIWHSDYTDEEGCFSINHSYRSRSIKLRVKFKNENARIKDLREWAGIFAYQSKAEVFGGPDYSDICVQFFRGGNNTIQTREWQAATVINGVAEYLDWELPLAEGPLDIWIDRNNNGAPMFGIASQVDYCNEEIILSDGTLLDNAEFALQVLTNIFGTVNLIDFFSPDVVLSDNPNLDRFKSTIYHELAHVGHYELAGECYWQKVRVHEFYMDLATSLDPSQSTDPYGDPTNLPFPEPPYMNFPIVAVTESWGEHVGVLYAFRKYGTATSGGISWGNRLERLTILNNFIPEGLHNDLMDGINLSDGTIGTPVTDNVEGATLIELYNLLDNETVAGYKADVISSTSAIGDINALFLDYGY